MFFFSVKCYYDLSKRLGKALRHEEKRCSYLTEEMKIMVGNQFSTYEQIHVLSLIIFSTSFNDHR